MKKLDLVLLHAPSVYDFRDISIMYGPISALVPSTSVFEMYPLGFITISEYLERNGLSVRIVNLAVRMVKDPNFDVEKFIGNLEPEAFGLDLHWLPHAHGSLEIAKIVKKYHPDIPTIFGGYSATYFSDELIEYPQVDYVLKGDSTEEPLRQLITTLKQKGNPDSIPNLTWKDKSGEIKSNEITHVSDSIDHVCMDHTTIIKSVIRSRDLIGHIPFENWLDYPLTPVLTCRGCSHCCVTCGGSSFAGRKYLNRFKPAFREPELLAQDIFNSQRYVNGPVFMIGDIRQAGDSYALTFLDALKKKKITRPVVFEFFTPPPDELFEKIRWAVPHFYVQASIESGDEKVRKAFGRPFTDAQVDSLLASALKNGCERFDLFFMTGLPQQTATSVLQTADYCEHLLETFADKRISLFISPLAPFLDPGSLVFENPDKFGYKLFHKSLEEHRQALALPSWKYTLNYETKWMSREEHVDSIHQVAQALNNLKAKYGVIPKEAALQANKQVAEAWDFMKKIDGIMETQDDLESKKTKLSQIKQEAASYSTAFTNQTREMEWPTKLVCMNPLTILRALLFSRTGRLVSLTDAFVLTFKILILQSRRFLRLLFETSRGC
jgi:B12-binding domain/radical SAM domain protein